MLIPLKIWTTGLLSTPLILQFRNVTSRRLSKVRENGEEKIGKIQ